LVGQADNALQKIYEVFCSFLHTTSRSTKA